MVCQPSRGGRRHGRGRAQTRARTLSVARRRSTLPRRVRVCELITDSRTAATIAGTAMLCAGVLYAGMATVRLYGQVFTGPQERGASALDAYFAPMHVRSTAALRDAVLAAKWPVDADVLVVADRSFDRQTIYQTYYSTSYVLYPRRVWLVSSCDPATIDAAIVRHDAGHVVSIGRTTVLPHAERLRISDMFTLVEFR